VGTKCGSGTRVLVTGAGGFIGSHLAEELVRRGCRVRAMTHYDSRADRSNLEFLPRDVHEAVEFIAGDVRDPFFMLDAARDVDVVFHLAALIAIPYSYAAPVSYVETNVRGTLNVMEACRRNDVSKIVHTSTSECYGTALYRPIDEKHPLQGQSPYSASKIGGDKVAESFFLSFDTPVATLRPFNTYGPRQSARAVTQAILSQLLSGCETLRLGSLEPERDLTYVSDTVAAFIAMAESDRATGELIHCGAGAAVTVGELAALAMNVVGREVEIVCDEERVRPAKSEVMALICNNTKAKEFLGWEPRVSLREGLAQCAGFLRENLDRFKPDEYTL
jgi:NAD dependent epimerase/dehydratase